MSPRIVAIKQSLNHTISLVQDEMARGGKNARHWQCLHDSLVWERDTVVTPLCEGREPTLIPTGPQAREEALDTHPTVIAHTGKQEAA